MRQGPRYRLELSPASVRVTATDYVRASDTANRREHGLRRDADMLLLGFEEISRRGAIADWSQKSRARMPLRFATLDYSAMFDQGDTPALVTLTYPGDWERLVPDAATFKRHVNKLRNSFRSRWGSNVNQWAGIWKMEFQRRGAPHLHIGTTVPPGSRAGMNFRQWLAREWSKIVFADLECAPSPWSPEGWSQEFAKHLAAGVDVSTTEGERYADPKRIGIYFAKHGLFEAKEYQNQIPELWRATDGGARFWGYWVVKPAIVSKETHEALIISIVRHLRKLADASSYSRRTTLVKGGHNPRTGEVWEARPRKRPVNRRVKRWRNRNGYGYMIVNDSTSMVADISRIILAHGAEFIVPDDASDYFDAGQPHSGHTKSWGALTSSTVDIPSLAVTTT